MHKIDFSKLCGIESLYKAPYCTSIIEESYKACDISLPFSGKLIKFLNSIILTGEEEWFFDENKNAYFYYEDLKFFDEFDNGYKDKMLCSHFRWIENKGQKLEYGQFCGGEKNEIYFCFNNGNNIEEWVKWLKNQEIPVQLVFVLKNPIVTYGKRIPRNKHQNIFFSFGNDLKPITSRRRVRLFEK